MDKRRNSRALEAGGLWAVLAMAVGLAGCDRRPQFVQASGVVLLDGRPVPNAAITFEPVGGGPLGAANTDSQGRFQLATSDRNGVVPGQYRAAVTKYEVLNIDLSKPGDFRTLEVRWIVPQRYSQLNTSGLQFKLD
ncbi:MAG: carboxypeptidase-like regulatory domain-containing protein, partial [Pirellulales bacterium]